MVLYSRRDEKGSLDFTGLKNFIGLESLDKEIQIYKLILKE
jgi:hypothetical protein